MPSKNQYKNHPSPSTGKMLKEYFEEKRIRKAALARAIGRHPLVLYDFQKNNTMQTCILWEICTVLRHNFFLDIASYLPKDFSTNATVDESNKERILALERENEILEAKIALLEGIMKRP